MKNSLGILLLTIVWVALTGSYSVLNIVLGVALSLLSASFVRRNRRQWQARLRPLRILQLVLLFVYELVLSGYRVARLVLSPRMELKPGIFAFPLAVDRDFEITLLANLITLTPGTLSVDVSADRKFLLVHTLDCSNPEQLRRDIAAGFEKKILEAFR